MHISKLWIDRTRDLPSTWQPAQHYLTRKKKKKRIYGLNLQVLFQIIRSRWSTEIIDSTYNFRSSCYQASNLKFGVLGVSFIKQRSFYRMLGVSFIKQPLLLLVKYWTFSLLAILSMFILLSPPISRFHTNDCSGLPFSVHCIWSYLLDVYFIGFLTASATPTFWTCVVIIPVPVLALGYMPTSVLFLFIILTYSFNTSFRLMHSAFCSNIHCMHLQKSAHSSQK